MSDNFSSVTETSELVNADPIHNSTIDAIHMDRKVGATQAAVTLMSGATITGKWAAGDLQAVRFLVTALVDVADAATSVAARVGRRNTDLEDDNRVLRDQLRDALIEVANLRADREEANVEGRRLLREMNQQLVTLRAQLLDAEHRAAAAADQVKDTEGQVAAAVTNFATMWTDTVRGQLYSRAIDTAMAADQAFEEAQWTEGGQYIQLANTWIALLNAVDSSLNREPM